MTGDAVNVSLIVIRAIHFAATAITAGVLIFRAVVAEPALHSAGAARVVVMAQIVRAAWLGLAITAASGAVWVLLQAAAMSGLSLREAVTADILSAVLTETQFGTVSECRFALAIVMAACLAYDRLPYSLALASGLGLVAGIAWTGHAGSTAGDWANLHLTADVLHLVAAAAWLGGLVPLALLLSQARRNEAHAWASLASQAARRFSILGIVSVGIIISTGIVNAWILVGSIQGADRNGIWTTADAEDISLHHHARLCRDQSILLTPDLALPSDDKARLRAMCRLTRNSKIEIALGLMIFAIVGALGTLHPAVHFAN